MKIELTKQINRPKKIIPSKLIVLTIFISLISVGMEAMEFFNLRMSKIEVLSTDRTVTNSQHKSPQKNPLKVYQKTPLKTQQKVQQIGQQFKENLYPKLKIPFSKDLPSFLAAGIINGKFSTSSDEHLIVTKEVKMIFDQFLNVEENWTEEELRALLIEYMTQSLPATALAEGLALLTNYLKYKQEVENIISKIDSPIPRVNSPVNPNSQQTNLLQLNLRSIQELHVTIKNLRRKTFGNNLANIFFKEEELIAAKNLEKLSNNF